MTLKIIRKSYQNLAVKKLFWVTPLGDTAEYIASNDK